MVSICDYWMSVIHRVSSIVNNCFKGHLLNIWLFFLLNLAGIILIWLSFIIVQMVIVHFISRSPRLKIDFEMKTLKIFLSDTKWPRALIFGM